MKRWVFVYLKICDLLSTEQKFTKMDYQTICGGELKEVLRSIENEIQKEIP